MNYGPVIPTLRVRSIAESVTFYEDVLAFAMKWTWSDREGFHPSGEATVACVESGEAVIFFSTSNGAESSVLYVELEYAGDVDALEPAQLAARIYRRSGVRVPLEGEELRIFEAVVRPSADAPQGYVAAERARLQKEIDRAEKMLANEKFVANADPAAVAGEREKLAQYVAERDAVG